MFKGFRFGFGATLGIFTALAFVLSFIAYSRAKTRLELSDKLRRAEQDLKKDSEA